MVNNSKTPIIELEQINKIYKPKGALLGAADKKKEVVALSDVSFKILPGEIFGLVGESGSGKTTAGRLMVKLEEPDSGQIQFDGNDITHLKGRRLLDFRRRVQMIFQDPYQSLNPQLSIFDTVSEPLLVHGLGNLAERTQKVVEALESAELSPAEAYLHRYPHQLSGGQRQRVAIARAMILNPGFMVADEPTSMLDATISFQIFNILLGLRQKLGIAFLFITHSLSAAKYLCDRIAVIYRGHLVETGPAAHVIEHPSHPYTQALMDALPKFGNLNQGRRFNTLGKTAHQIPSGPHCPFFPLCRKAADEHCGQEQPEMREIDSGHCVACIYAD